jgi:hypothetical protein
VDAAFKQCIYSVTSIPNGTSRESRAKGLLKTPVWTHMPGLTSRHRVSAHIVLMMFLLRRPLQGRVEGLQRPSENVNAMKMSCLPDIVFVLTYALMSCRPHWIFVCGRMKDMRQPSEDMLRLDGPSGRRTVCIILKCASYHMIVMNMPGLLNQH